MKGTFLIRGNLGFTTCFLAAHTQKRFLTNRFACILATTQVCLRLKAGRRCVLRTLSNLGHTEKELLVLKEALQPSPELEGTPGCRGHLVDLGTGTGTCAERTVLNSHDPYRSSNRKPRLPIDIVDTGMLQQCKRSASVLLDPRAMPVFRR